MASVAKFKLNEAPRLLTHCSRTQKTPGSHIHQERTCLNFNMAAGRHEGVSDYEFVKDKIHQDDVRMLKRDDVKTVCSWAVTMPRELCHEVVDSDGETFYVPNDDEECRDFFKYSYDFFKEKHGEENIISAYVHMDENVPHMHFTFVPIVKDKNGGLKVCAKEALADCYGAKFQIALQDYVSERMGKELNMVKKDTVDYERNVKELKKKTLNERCAYLARQISRSEEELARKERVLKTLEKSEKAKENIDFSLYGTPLESTTYKFAKCLQKRFGIIKGVTDRNYITNSYHVHVTEDINAFDKLKFESEFQKLSPGGAISYVEVPNMQNNIPAVVTLIQYIYETIMYAELNTKSDYCEVCGFDGEIQIVEDKHGKLVWKCPNCGNRDQNRMSVARRTCGYIGSQFWNQGRTQEIKERVLHL